MKAWQIFAVGTLAALVLFSFHAYESALAALVAVGLLAGVMVGFCVRPRNEVFYLRTTIRVYDPDYAVAVEHDRIAIRVELTRLWLLFIPTFAAIAFLLITAASGSTWNVSLFDSVMVRWVDLGPYPVLMFFRLLVVGVFGLLSAWITERWVLRDASACSADSVQSSGHRIIYSFQDPSGEYYGGVGFPFGSMRSPELETIVFYSTRKPDLSTIAMCCLFHRPVMIGRGLTDLDEATVASALKTRSAPQML
jgi:hypothetical protein